MAKSNKIESLQSTYQPYYIVSDLNKTPAWANTQNGGTPIVADALNQMEVHVQDVYNVIGNINNTSETKTPLQRAVKTYTENVQKQFNKILDLDVGDNVTVNKATSVDITTQEASDATVKFQVGIGKAYEKTINNVDHAISADKWSIARKIKLTGNVTDTEVPFDGSSDIKLTIDILDDSHNHIIGNVDGLQDNLTSLDKRLVKVESFFNTDEEASVFDEITTLKEIVDEFKDDYEDELAIKADITELQAKPVVTYTTTAEDYAAADEIVFVCGGAPTN